ncbi:MAG: DUF2793 domain-containing protein [Rhodobacterales bacterium]|nr:DUF2793 domain-containing protein [Rhodobacterales bacterium]
MPDTSPNLDLPYIQPSQAQKHVTHNEAIRRLDALVQMVVVDRDLALPPAAAPDGARYIVATGGSADWTGWDGNIALATDGGWTQIIAQEGWLVWVADEAVFVVRTAAGWTVLSTGGGGGGGGDVPDADFTLTDDVDPTRKARFDAGAISTGTTRILTLPDANTVLAGLAGTQTFTGNKTFAGTVTVASATASLGTSAGTATYGLGNGATTSGTTKTVNLGTGGVSGSVTVVNVGSATAGAGGTTVFNTPTVTYANAVTTVSMPQANLVAQVLGLGGATADATNRLSVNTPAVLFNHAGAGVEATVNKASAGADAAFAFKTGFSTRALIGLLANDDFSFKVSPDGASYTEAMRISAASGQVGFAEPVQLGSQAALPAAPAAGEIKLYARTRAGAPRLETMTPDGRGFPVQSHVAWKRQASWTPWAAGTVNGIGMNINSTGTNSVQGIGSGSLAATMRRWRTTSAATAYAPCGNHPGVSVCLRGSVAGTGGFLFATRISLVALQATGIGFFGLNAGNVAPNGSWVLNNINAGIGLGFDSAAHTNWQIMHKTIGGGVPTLVDLGAAFPLVTGGVITLVMQCDPAASSVFFEVTNDETGAVYAYEATADLPPAGQVLAPRLMMNNQLTAAAVAYECGGLLIETDY